METELAWFRLSDKWKVADEFKQHIPSQQYGEMTREERENAMKQISKLYRPKFLQEVQNLQVYTTLIKFFLPHTIHCSASCQFKQHW